MTYINVGAEWSKTGRPIPTKTALRSAIAAEPSSVVFYSTALMGKQVNGTALDIVAEHGPSIALSVVGPDPYTKRSWYATVTFKNGAVKVS